MTVDTKPDVTFADNVTKFVVAAGVLILVLAAFGIGFGALRAREANAATNEWLSQVRSEDYAQAHARLAEDRRRQIDPDRFRSVVSSNATLRGYRQFRREAVETDSGTLVVKGRIVSDAGEQAVEFRWVRQSGPEGRRLMLDNLVFAGSSALFTEEAP